MKKAIISILILFTVSNAYALDYTLETSTKPVTRFQLPSNFSTDASLFFYCPFNEGSGTTPMDIANVNIGSMTLNGSGATYTTSGMFGAALNTSANAKNYAGFHCPAYNIGNSSFTINMWVYPTHDATPGRDTLISGEQGGMQVCPFLLYMNGNGRWAAEGFAATEATYVFLHTLILGDQLKKDTWTMVTVVRWIDTPLHTDNCEIYFNGIQCTRYAPDSHTSENEIVTNNIYPIEIGRGVREGDTSFQGYIDEVAIWKRALSLAEIRDIYRRGSGGN